MSGQSAPTLYFIRHGETDWNAQGRLQGHRDTALNERGRRQAVASAQVLRTLVPDPGYLPYLCSPLARARETMELARASLGLDASAYTIDQRLTELSFGDWEGHTWRELRETHARLYRERRADIWNFVPPGAESYAGLAARLQPLIAAIDRDTVLVSHGGVARALAALICGVPGSEAAHVDVWQGRVLVFAAGDMRWAGG